MVALSFSKQFADDVRDGKKCQTIRADSGKRRLPMVGEELQLYTGMRTKHCKLLRRVQCSSLIPVVINASTRTVTLKHWDKSVAEILTGNQLTAFAEADGFPDVDSFFTYFCSDSGKPFFSGWLIVWKV